MDFTRLEPGRKFVVIHEDDVGMTHGANAAFVELSALGACSSGSVMPPCPWFPEAIEMAKADPTLDLGVHLTLTSEKIPYRWRPLTRPALKTGLTDPNGYFWPDVPNARHADPRAVEVELRSQIDATLAAGVDVTHLDAHMGTAMCPEFIDIYIKLGHDYRLPLLLVKDYNTFNPRSYSGPISNDNYNAGLARARGSGFAVFDIVQETMWNRKEDAETAYGAMFRRLPVGSRSCLCISMRPAISRSSSPRKRISARRSTPCSRAARSNNGRRRTNSKSSACARCATICGLVGSERREPRLIRKASRPE